MRFGSVCSGIEAASVAWKPLGWEAAWFSEIEPFPCAVLKHHYPDTPNYGDMKTLSKRILSGEVEAPELLCGGTPCQAFSVAGKRQSLDDDRGNLSLVFIEIANAIDHVRTVHNLRGCIVFWENVPGVLSTKDNAFGCLLGGLVGASAPLSTETGRWPSYGAVTGPQRQAAWRVLDAQHFGVPQRRKRVFVIATPIGGGIDPTKILFEPASLSGNSEPSKGKGEEAPVFTKSRFGSYSHGIGTLTKRSGDVGGGSENLIVGTLTVGDVTKGFCTNQAVDSNLLVIEHEH